MQLTKVTITGADDNVSPDELKKLSEKYPFVEWGILFTRTQRANPRYPSGDAVSQFCSQGMNLSAHFCGWYAREILENHNYYLLEKVGPFERVQINYNFGNSDKWDLPPLIRWISDNPKLSIIFQVNETNKTAISWIDNIIDIPSNIHFLYDSSGGRGTPIDSMKPPFRTYTGYSGGINPKNVRDIIHRITDYANSDKFWIDMESGVRTDDFFDLKKVETVLSVSEKYIQKELAVS